MIEERRKHPRFPFNRKGELRIDYIPCLGELVDLSRFGALFRSGIHPVGLECGRECSLNILHLNEELLCTIDGHVAHRCNNLIGIRFERLDEESLSRLMHIGTLNLAPAKMFDRSLSALLQAA